MKTSYESMCYQDFWQTIETNAIRLTPENACCVTFLPMSLWNEQTTAIMDAFHRDQKTFMLIRYGDYDDSRLWLVAKYEPHRSAPKSAPTISTIKADAMNRPCLRYDKADGKIRTACTLRLKNLLLSVMRALPKPCADGIYMVKNPELFQAQIPEDRIGFYKNNIRGQIISEKPYGYCSLVFSVVTAYLN